MSGRSLLGPGHFGRARTRHFITASFAVAGFGALGGCLTRPLAPETPAITTTVTASLGQSTIDKIDLLLVVDNSRSMADKQKILSVALPDLLGPLVNPPCLDATGNAVAGQPSGPLDACPSGSTREFPPVVDIHIGVITSSLGTFGAGGDDNCDTGAGTLNDFGWLISRQDSTDPAGAQVPTYQNGGFLAWDPKQQLDPPGLSDFATLQANLASIVTGAGENGCGYESQNEAWYRFLVDPSPPVLAVNPAKGAPVVTAQIDTKILAQRKAFLRPDSLLAIINVTDETDTSIKESSIYPNIANGSPLPHARSECTTTADGPADHCCDSCGVTPQPEGCPEPDPVCQATPDYTSTTDNVALHAFGLVSHKERFGLDFFYPTSRYVQGLTQPTVPDASGNMVANPVLSRGASLVFYAAITGVPWQLIARQTNGAPDLSAGFMTAADLSKPDGKGHTYWDDIAGDPDTYTAASSPFMVESLTARTGVDPITGTSLAAGNAINGGDRPIPAPQGDIEYACIFPILAAIDCSASGAVCDCVYDPTNPLVEDPSTNPLCAPNPSDPRSTAAKPVYTLQTMAKAYPGVRNLAIARGLGDQGIAASICAKTATGDPTAPDFGYNPAVNAIVAKLKTTIAQPCLAVKMKVEPSGQVSSCLVLEAVPQSGGACTCDATARQPVTAEHQAAVGQAEQLVSSTAGDCFCEITQVSGAALASCQHDQATTDADGWCYVDTTTGNPALVSGCPASEQSEVRLVGAGQQAPSSVLFVTCEQDN